MNLRCHTAPSPALGNDTPALSRVLCREQQNKPHPSPGMHRLQKAFCVPRVLTNKKVKIRTYFLYDFLSVSIGPYYLLIFPLLQLCSESAEHPLVLGCHGS